MKDLVWTILNNYKGSARYDKNCLYFELDDTNKTKFEIFFSLFRCCYVVNVSYNDDTEIAESYDCLSTLDVYKIINHKLPNFKADLELYRRSK